MTLLKWLSAVPPSVEAVWAVADSEGRREVIALSTALRTSEFGRFNLREFFWACCALRLVFGEEGALRLASSLMSEHDVKQLTAQNKLFTVGDVIEAYGSDAPEVVAFDVRRALAREGLSGLSYAGLCDALELGEGTPTTASALAVRLAPSWEVQNAV